MHLQNTFYEKMFFIKFEQLIVFVIFLCMCDVSKNTEKITSNVAKLFNERNFTLHVHYNIHARAIKTVCQMKMLV